MRIMLMTVALLFAHACVEAGAAVRLAVMGCGPYTDAASEALPRFVADEQLRGEADYLVHLGDLVTGARGRAGLEEAVYRDFASVLRGDGTIPVIVTLGDNEWNDTSDPAASLAHWNTHLQPLNRATGEARNWREQAGETGNFAFDHDGVRIIALRLTGGAVYDTAVIDAMVSNAGAWVEQELTHELEGIAAAVVLLQAHPVPDSNPYKTDKQGRPIVRVRHQAFLDGLVAGAQAFERPLLICHADKHTWRWDTGYADQPNITRMEVAKLGPADPPVLVTVDPDAEAVFTVDRRLDQVPETSE